MNKQEQEILINAFEQAIKDYLTAINAKEVERFYSLCWELNLEKGLCFYFIVCLDNLESNVVLNYLYKKLNLNKEKFLFPIIVRNETEYNKQACLLPRLNLLKELLNDIKNTNCHE